MSLTIRKAAPYEDDVRDLAEFGYVHFGALQSTRFLQKLDEVEALVSAFPHLGAVFGDARSVRRVLLGPYAIYYRVGDSDLTFMRIVRQERDTSLAEIS